VRRNGRRIVLAAVLLLAGCGHGGGSSANSPPSHPVSPLPPGANVLEVSVGNWDVCIVVNELCASITICQPGTSNCATVTDLLVDTGSFGLRVFDSVVSPSLPPVVNARGDPIGECSRFLDGSAFWGAVQMADVRLGGEPPVQVPIQVIDPTFGGQSVSNNPCNATVESSPSEAHLNGILGIGLFQYDCGPFCVANARNSLYFSCSGATCTGATVELPSQVQNPVFSLPVDNNGVILQLPAIPPDPGGADAGADSATGSLVLGIGTASNNAPPPGLTVYATDPNGNFTITLNETAYAESFIDSGTNAFLFPSTLPACAGSLQVFYCPAATTSVSGTAAGSNGTQGVVEFQIANARNLVFTGNRVFDNLGGTLGAGNRSVDLGLPFALGRTVYFGMQGRDSSLGTGPYWAF